MSGTTHPDSAPDEARIGRFQPERTRSFRYVDMDFDRPSGRLLCRYALDDLRFEERITFGTAGNTGPDPAGLAEAARLVFLLAGVSYYKAAAPPEIEVGFALTPAERTLLEAFYLDGLGEFALRNSLDLGGLRIDAPAAPPAVTGERSPGDRALIPFGGGIDSIVTVEGVRDAADAASLFIVSREGDRFDAIEAAASLTGMPVVRAERRLDEKILRSRELGFRNGHVPVTGVISAIAVMAAVLDGSDTVVMSNEWSASSGNVERDGRTVNHQWSKTLAFEDLFRAALAEALPAPVDYFSWLRPFSELWVARRFAELGRYHGSFRSCNRAFHIDRTQRLDHWCGRCDKCCFVDLVLAPFLPAARLREVFAEAGPHGNSADPPGRGADPLDKPDLLDVFRTLTGVSGQIKPFECVGDISECRTAALLAHRRPDRQGSTVLGALAGELDGLTTVSSASGSIRTGSIRTGSIQSGSIDDQLAALLRPQGPHRIPDRYAPPDLLD